jgi:delta14-sterol reductase
MVLVNAFHLLYVADAMWFEPCILTTMDITTDGFGFMLAFGDLTWVPFTYSLQARLLVDYSPVLPTWALAGIVLLNCVGYVVFRGSNSQKDQFRRDPNHASVKHLKVQTPTLGSNTRFIRVGTTHVSPHHAAC